MNALVTDMAQAIRSRTALPRMPSDLTLDEAYVLQQQLVKEVADGPVAGLKAGMTAEAGQKAFGLTHPLIGSLYSWGKLSPSASFEHAPGVSLECEIGLIVDDQGNATSAGPVIEVPRMAWGDPEDAKGANLTACNIAADRYIVGEFGPLRDDYESLSVKLTRDGETVCDASLADALGGPAKALEWMRTEAAARGLAISSGMLFITGACGGIHPAERGSYIADYGVLGTIEFTVV